MGVGAIHCLVFLLLLLLPLFCNGGTGIEVQDKDRPREPRRLLAGAERDMPERDVTTPLVTVPVSNYPTATPAGTPLPAAVPSLAHPAAGGGGGGSWCVASPSAGAAALQVALDYACGPQGGADCSAIQPGGGCAIPDTVRDHASFAFNSYYQKNPVQTSCDFAGSAILTTTDPQHFDMQVPGDEHGSFDSEHYESLESAGVRISSWRVLQLSPRIRRKLPSSLRIHVASRLRRQHQRCHGDAGRQEDDSPVVVVAGVLPRRDGVPKSQPVNEAELNWICDPRGEQCASRKIKWIEADSENRGAVAARGRSRVAVVPIRAGS